MKHSLKMIALVLTMSLLLSSLTPGVLAEPARAASGEATIRREDPAIQDDQPADNETEETAAPAAAPAGTDGAAVISDAAEDIPEPAAFEQSCSVSGGVVTVHAAPGVFPAGAELSVKQVSADGQSQAEAAVGEANVAASYAFDIKVIDPITKQELQPAEGQHASVSFALAETADRNLKTSVYHIDESGEAEKLNVSAGNETVVVRDLSANGATKGSSLYALKIIYNNREYLMMDETVPLTGILGQLGLTGPLQEVNYGVSQTVCSIDYSSDYNDWVITNRGQSSGSDQLEVKINDIIYTITVTAHSAGKVSSWAELQAALNAGGIVVMEDDITAAPGEAGLVVPSGVTATLDLKGHTLSRGLIYVEDDGYVIKNEGTLTITDSRVIGKITGGRNNGISEIGGGIQNTGTLNLMGGEISGNAAIVSAHSSGGGIYNGGTLHLNGGKIINNVGIGGGGIYNEGRITLSGDPVVMDNDGGRHGGNLFLSWEGMIEVTGPLLYGANLHVEAPDDRTAITKYYGKYNEEPPRYYFNADSASKSIYRTARAEKGEVGLGTSHTITVETTDNYQVTVAESAMAGDTVEFTIVTLGAIGYRGYWVNDEWHPNNLEPDDTLYSFTMPNEDVTLRVGAWNRITTETKTRIIGTVQNNTDNYLWNVHATLTPDQIRADDDEIVTLTLETDEGYGPIDNDSIQIFRKYSDGSQDWYAVGQPVEGSENTWTFQMPRVECVVYAVAEIEWKNTPPSGNSMPLFYIDSDCTEHGSVEAPRSNIIVGEYKDNKEPLSTQITLNAVPDAGYTLKGWEVVLVTRQDGNTVPVEDGYSLPVEYVNGHYELNINTVDAITIKETFRIPFVVFRIRAIFEELPQQPISLEIHYYDMKGTVHRGSSLTEVEPQNQEPYYVGSTMSVRVDRVQGADFSTYTRHETGQEMQYPEIFYTPRDNSTDRYKYIDDLTWSEDGTVFSFTVPDDIHPNDSRIIIHTVFEDSDSRLFRVVPFSDELITVSVGYQNPVSTKEVYVTPGETVHVSVTAKDGSGYKPTEDLTVEYYENGASQGVPYTGVSSSADAAAGTITYTYTFTMPAHDVYVSAQKADYTFRVRWDEDVTEKPASIRVARQSYTDGEWVTVATRTVSADNGWKTGFPALDSNAANGANANRRLLAGRLISLRGEGDDGPGGEEPRNRIRILDDDGNVQYDSVNDNPDANDPGCPENAGERGANLKNVSHDENVEADAKYDLDYDVDGKNTDARLNNQKLTLRFPVEAVWAPEDNAPISVQVQLQHQASANGPWTTVDGKTADLSDSILEEESWKHTFELEADKIEGNYRVRELNNQNAAVEDGSVAVFNNRNYLVTYAVDYSNNDMGYTTITNQGPMQYKAKIVWPANAPEDAIPVVVTVHLQKRTNNGAWEEQEELDLSEACQWEGTFSMPVEPAAGVEWRVREEDDSHNIVVMNEDSDSGEAGKHTFAVFTGNEETVYDTVTYQFDAATGVTTITNGDVATYRSLTVELKWEDDGHRVTIASPVTVVLQKLVNGQWVTAPDDNNSLNPEREISVNSTTNERTFELPQCKPSDQFRIRIKAKVGAQENAVVENNGDRAIIMVCRNEGDALKEAEFAVNYAVNGDKTTITSTIVGYKAKIVWPANAPDDTIPDEVKVHLQKKTNNGAWETQEELELSEACRWEGTFLTYVPAGGGDEWRVREQDDTRYIVVMNEDSDSGEANRRTSAVFTGMEEVVFDPVTYQFDANTRLTTITNGDVTMYKNLAVELKWEDNGHPINVNAPVTVVLQKLVDGQWVTAPDANGNLRPEREISANSTRNERTFELSRCKSSEQFRIRLKAKVGGQENTVVENDGDRAVLKIPNNEGDAFSEAGSTVNYTVNGDKTTITNNVLGYKAKIVWPANAPDDVIPHSVRVLLQKKENNSWNTKDELTLSEADNWEGTFSTFILPGGGDEWRVREEDGSGWIVVLNQDSDRGEARRRTFALFTEPEETVYSTVTYQYDAQSGLTTITNDDVAVDRILTIELKWEDAGQQISSKEPVTVVLQKLVDGHWVTAPDDDGTIRPEREITADSTMRERTFELSKCKSSEQYHIRIKAKVGNQENAVVENNGETVRFKIRKNQGDNPEEAEYRVNYAVRGDKTTVTNTLRNLNAKYKVTVNWKDGSNQEGRWPDNVRLILKKNGANEKTMTLQRQNNQNQLVGEFEEVAVVADGQSGDFTLEKDGDVPGYQFEVQKNGFAFTVTFTHAVEKTSVNGRIFWLDNNSTERPYDVRITLKKGDAVLQHKMVSSNDSWTFAFNNLNKYENGQVIQYEVSQSTVQGYRTERAGYNFTNTKQNNNNNNNDDPNQGGDPGGNPGGGGGGGIPWLPSIGWGTLGGIGIIIGGIFGSGLGGGDDNDRDEKIDVSGTVNWNHGTNPEAYWPTKCTVRLLADGAPDEDQSIELQGTGNTWTFTFGNVPKYQPYALIPTKYTVTADAIENYTVSFSGTTVTYTYAPGEAQAAVTIAWDDIEDLDRIRPASVDVVIRSEDGSDTKTITLTKGNGWAGTIGLNAALTYDRADVVMTDVITGEDTETTYAVDGMGNQTQGFFFRLTHTPKLPGVSGEIVWDDDDNRWGARPDSVEVTLWARLTDGTEIDMSTARDVDGELVPNMTKTVTAEDDWKCSFVFNKIPVAYNGEPITWFLKQNPGTVTGYEEAAVDGMRVTNSYVRTTSHTITITVDKPDAVDAAVTVESGAHATDDANVFSAYEGDTVTLAVTRPEDCVLALLTATGSDDTPVPIEDNSFTVPACDVSVHAQFKLEMGLTVSLEDWTYGDEPNTPVIDGKPDSLMASFAYRSREDGSAWSAEVPVKAGDYVVKAHADGIDDYQGEDAEADFRITQRPLTIIRLYAEDKEYDGTNSANVTGTPRLRGKLADDDVSLVTDTATPPVFEDADAGRFKAVYTEGYSLTGADADNYSLIQPEDLTADITPKEVGLSWGNNEFIYDGNEHVPTVELTGVLENDACEVTVTGAQIDPGEYTATATELSNPNYKLPENPAQAFTITNAASDMTPPTAVTGLVFTGSPQTLVNPGSATGGTMQYSPDRENWSTDVPTGTDAGVYNVYYKVVGEAHHSDVEAAGPVSVTIEKAAALPQVLITHDVGVGTENVNVSLPDVMPDDAGTLVYSAGQASSTGSVSVSDFTVSTVNQAAIVTAALSGGTAQDSVILPVTIESRNYRDSIVQIMVAFTDKEDASVSITEEGLTKTYGDSEFALHASAEHTGAGTGTWTWTSSNENAATVTNDGNVTILGKGVTVITARYSSDTTVGQAVVTLTVNPKQVNLVWSETTAFTYDGQSHEPAATADGLVNNDLVAVIVEGAQTDAGSYEATAVGLTGSGAANYRLPDAADDKTASFTINRAGITVTTSGAVKSYDGTPLTRGDGAYITGLVNDETATVTATGTRTEVGSSDNSYIIKWGTAKQSNYIVTEENLGRLDVTNNSAEITLTAPSDSKIYDGTPLTCDGTGEKKVTASGLPGGFTVEATASGSQTDAGESPNVVNDGYVIRNAEGEPVTDCFTNVKKADGTLTVGKKSISRATVTLDNASLTYDGTEKTVSVVSVTLDGDALTQADYTVSDAGLKGTDADTYTVTITGKGNYKNTASAKWVIWPAGVNVTVTGYYDVYDGQAHGITVDTGDSGAAVYYGLTELTGNNYNTEGSATNPPAFTNVSENTVYFYVETGNYEPKPVSGSATVTIRKAPLTVTADAKSKVYGEDDPELTYTCEGLAESDTIQGTLTRAAGEDVETYAITVGTLTAGGNYDMQFEGAALTITKAEPTVTPPTPADGLHYNGSAQELVNAGEADGGEMQYSLDGESWSTDIPTGTEMGDYTVWYRVVGDGNHNDTAPESIPVTISDQEPMIVGYDLVLGGVLGLRYYVFVPDGFDGTGAEMTFSLPYRDLQTVPYSSAGTSAEGYKIFTCNVYAYQMADTITAAFSYQKNGTTKTLNDEYSVKQYLDSFGSGYSGTVQTMVTKTRAFGHFIQPYLGRVHNWTVGGKYAEMDYSGTVDVAAAKAGSEPYKYTLTTLDSAYVRAAQYRLLLNADTSFIVEVILKEAPAGSVSMTVDGRSVSPDVSGTTYHVEVGNIAANNLAVSHYVVMQIDGATVFDFTASPLSFVYTVLSKSSPAEDEQNAMAALYEYYQAAHAYAQSN